ncbi:GNAT family N-acetyltransferase [Clostridium intestinale]|uniref:GNAT family N-acetyltransferase n=1 Tax=Clostridium intestinale TaxID=36845 RepID=A0A7D6ZYB0_9CLOT|nr:GNAT family N-acetyltransferase [Clostridium intestinale]QLY78535.1 GNAT family N-acetyltransferase [Clostridium intestinale]
MINYRLAGKDDIDSLVSLRAEFIGLNKSHEAFEKVYENIKQYFEAKISTKECFTILAEDKNSIIGTGIVFFYDSVPSLSNISGKNAYKTSMYVKEEYRRMKIGSTILEKLIEISKANNAQFIMLNATEIGRKLYNQYEFKDIENGMILKV